MIISIDQHGVIKRYFSSQIKPLVEQPLVFDGAFADPSIEYNQKQAHQDEEEPSHQEGNELLSADSQS